MARISLEKDSLAAKVKDIETLISLKMINKLALEDLKALYLLSNKIQDSVSDVLDNAFPNFVVKKNKYNASPAASYRDNGNSIYSSTPSNNVVGIASISEQPQLSVSGDLGTGFSAGGISLFDVTDEVNNNLVNKEVIKTIQAQNPGIVVEEKPIDDELGRLNDIFGSVEDAQ